MLEIRKEEDDRDHTNKNTEDRAHDGFDRMNRCWDDSKYIETDDDDCH